MTLMSILFLVLNGAHAADPTILNNLFRGGSSYLQVDASGKIEKPNSALPFKKTSDGWSSDYDMLSQMKEGKSNYYLAVTKSEYGKSALYETVNDGLVAMTNCSGNFKSSNSTGIKCSTITLDKCTELMRNFTNTSNPAMTNPVVRSAFAGAKWSTDGDFIEKFKANLRNCSDAMMLVNNMEGNANGFKLDSNHEKVLKSKLQTFSVGSADESWNLGQATTLNQAMIAVINKAEIFSKCGELLRYDQQAKGRTALIPPKASARRTQKPASGGGDGQAEQVER